MPNTTTSSDGISSKRILVTGGAGAIGSALCAVLIERGANVTILDDLSSGHRELIPEGVEFIEGDITDDAVLDRAFRDAPQVVIHLAALFANQNSVDHPEQDLRVNGMGTLKLLERARTAQVSRFVYTSSSCVYGDMDGAGSEDAPVGAVDTPYAISKLLGEKYTSYFHQHYDLPTVILRIFNSYGPGELPGKYRNAVPNMIWRAMQGKPLTIYGTGEETRDFNYIGNLVQACVTSIEHPAAVGEIFNIGSGHETRIADLASMINEVTGNTAGVVHEPRRSWDHVLRRCADVAKAKRVLGYTPETDTLRQRLEETYAWIAAHRDIIDG